MVNPQPQQQPPSLTDAVLSRIDKLNDAFIDFRATLTVTLNHMQRTIDDMKAEQVDQARAWVQQQTHNEHTKGQLAELERQNKDREDRLRCIEDADPCDKLPDHEARLRKIEEKQWIVNLGVAVLTALLTAAAVSLMTAYVQGGF